MVTEDDVRRVALSLPATVEKSYNRLPSFRVGSSLFIRIHELPDVLFVRCANLEERDELLKPNRRGSSSPPITTATRRSSFGSDRPASTRWQSL